MSNTATEYGIPLTEEYREIGGFLHRHQGRFLKEDNIQVIIQDKGTASKTYKIQKATISTISTISKKQELMMEGFKETSNDGDSDIPFL